MKRAFAGAIIILMALPLFALESTEAAAAAQSKTKKNDTASGEENTTDASGDSPLVKAAKSSTKNRAKSRVSITDDDLKKTTGKLSIISSSPLAELPVEEQSAESEIARQQRLQKERKAAEDRVAAARKEVEGLESLLADYEDSYYLADDADYREEVIEQRFDKTRRELDEALERLATAQEELSRLR